jgi:hypothetical protein
MEKHEEVRPLRNLSIEDDDEDEDEVEENELISVLCAAYVTVARQKWCSFLQQIYSTYIPSCFFHKRHPLKFSLKISVAIVDVYIFIFYMFEFVDENQHIILITVQH